NFENKVKDDEIAFLVIHFLTAVSRHEQNKDRKVRAVVFCNYGLATGMLLAENLERFFPIEIVTVLGINELYLLKKLEFDVVFSTSSIDVDDYPYLVIEPLIDDKNKKVIDRF